MHEHDVMRKQKLRDKLKADTEAWLAKGNEVKEVASDVTAQRIGRDDNDGIFGPKEEG